MNLAGKGVSRMSSILIVEDESITAMEIQQILVLNGYNPHTAYSGEDAIKKAIEVKPDLILMDIKLKGETDGIKTIEKINEFLDVPVIYLTALSDKETLKSADLTNPSAYLFKPFNDDELLNNIKIAISKHKDAQD